MLWKSGSALQQIVGRRVTSTALVLIVLSTFVHSGWNFIGKHRNPAPAFMLLASILGTTCLLPALLIYGHLSSGFPPVVWMLLAVTGFFQAVYYIGVA